MYFLQKRIIKIMYSNPMRELYYNSLSVGIVSTLIFMSMDNRKINDNIDELSLIVYIEPIYIKLFVIITITCLFIMEY